MVYCTARDEYHACRHPWDYAAHPGDGTDHDCHCDHSWIDRRYTSAHRPCIAYVVSSGWKFSISLDSEPEVGPVFAIWFGHRGIHLPLRWRPWK